MEGYETTVECRREELNRFSWRTKEQRRGECLVGGKELSKGFEEVVRGGKIAATWDDEEPWTGGPERQ